MAVMDEQRLAEIEVSLGYEHPDGTCIVDQYVLELIDEIRRLRRENRLMRLSRGDLCEVGAD